MSIIDRWKERRAEKKERQRHGTMKLITDKDPGTDEEVGRRMLSFVDNDDGQKEEESLC